MMTKEGVIALLEHAQRASEQGLTRMVVMKSWRRAPRNWDRVLLLPGCYGRIVGSTTPGRYMVDVVIADLVSAFEKVML